MVRRADDIEKIIDSGNFSEAYQAIEDVLSLGPKNTNVMKLKARLFYLEGKFEQEALMWRKIHHLDEEDEEAREYFERTMLEQREHEYFSDLLPNGGIRFSANPRSVVTTSFIGILGCAAFLTMTNFSHRFPILANATLGYISFAVLVGLPWLVIFYVYFKALKDITIDTEAIHLRTRSSELRLYWRDTAKFYLARQQSSKGGDRLYVVLVPKEAQYSPLLIPILGKDSVIRAPSYFVREISRVFQEPAYETLEAVSQDQKPLLFS